VNPGRSSTQRPSLVHRTSITGGRRGAVHSSGRDDLLGTAYSDHDLFMFLAGVADPEAILDDRQRVERRGDPAHECPMAGS
jgi:hypothetical protein